MVINPMLSKYVYKHGYKLTIRTLPDAQTRFEIQCYWISERFIYNILDNRRNLWIWIF